MNTKRGSQAFPITSVCRDDLIRAEYTQKLVDMLDDADMKKIASEMSDAYCNNGFWIDLPIIVDSVLAEKAEKEGDVLIYAGSCTNPKCEEYEGTQNTRPFCSVCEAPMEVTDKRIVL